MSLPFLIFSDQSGKIYTHHFLRMAVNCLNQFALPQRSEIISLPQGSTLFSLPERSPVGFNPQTKQLEILSTFNGKKVFAVGAFLVPAYARLHLPAYSIVKPQTLPLWAYAAAGFYNGSFCCAATRVDYRRRQSPRFYNKQKITKAVGEFFKQYRDNRLYGHLANCALNYNCLAAKNLFLERWEAPLPTARFCNARCLGCLSHQESDCDSSHKRINFKPDSSEIAQVAINHLIKASEPIVSFGQGCEGEPLLEADCIAKAIKEIRKVTSCGTINMNTNASLPSKVELLCRAGIDSFRVSLNSPSEELYNLYFRPQNYQFKDVLKSITIAKKYKKFVSINLFVFPGITDSLQEKTALINFLKKTQIDMIQWRNLNIDPEYYLASINCKNFQPQGVLSLIAAIKAQFPKLKMGYFNLTKEQFYTNR